MSTKKREREGPSKGPKFGKKMRTSMPARQKSRALVSKETGYVDVGPTNYNIDTTGSIALLTTIAQGTAVTQRVGKKVQWKSIQIRGSIAAGTTAIVNHAAVLLVYDRRPTGSLPAITDILVAANESAMNNDANSGRFKILRRWDEVLIGNTTTPATGKESCEMDDFLLLNNLPGVFKAATTGAIADYEEGPIYVVTVGNNAAGNTAAVANLNFRTRFFDV